MMYPKSIKINSIDTEKKTVIATFSGTCVHRKMNIVSIDLFGGLRLEYPTKLDQAVYVVPEYELGKWVKYSVEDPELEAMTVRHSTVREA